MRLKGTEINKLATAFRLTLMNLKFLFRCHRLKEPLNKKFLEPINFKNYRKIIDSVITRLTGSLLNMTILKDYLFTGAL